MKSTESVPPCAQHGQDRETGDNECPHPVWCRQHGRPNPEDHDDCEGLAYSLDVGEHFSYTVIVNATMYRGQPGEDPEPPKVQLHVRENEMFGAGTAYLSPTEAGRLVQMLQRAVRDIELGERR